MDRTTLALLLATLAPLPSPSAVGRAEPVTPSPGSGGCKITVSAHNSGDLQAVVSRDSEFRSKAWRGWSLWEKIGEARWVGPGTMETWTYELTAACGTPHRYRFLIKHFDRRDQLVKQTWIVYPPREADATTEREFAIGDLGAI